MASSAQPRKARTPHGSVYGRSLEHQKQGACSFSPSGRGKDSPQQLVAPVQPLKSVDSSISPCIAGSAGSESGAVPFDICMSDNKCPIKIKPSLLAINRDKKRDRELSKDVASFQYLRPGMVLLKRFIKPNDQDKGKSRSSLEKGLPVVSFSVGDTTEFLYGDVRDERKVVDLESGDVLIFGGKSRHMFHGVSNMKVKTAPTWLTDEANLRPGRLNLTFRQY